MAYCETAKRVPFLLITDLDAVVCAPALISTWSGGTNPPDDFIFRVAARQVESCLLADPASMKRLLGQRANVPRDLTVFEITQRVLVTFGPKGFKRREKGFTY